MSIQAFMNGFTVGIVLMSAIVGYKTGMFKSTRRFIEDMVTDRNRIITHTATALETESSDRRYECLCDWDDRELIEFVLDNASQAATKK